ncbi:MAG: hypothetical protein ACI86M_000890 [Saprospiraceae bacterium]|jgi:hypothetical protein
MISHYELTIGFDVASNSFVLQNPLPPYIRMTAGVV